MTSSSPASDTRERFQFGENWLNYLRTVDEERIHEAVLSLQEMLNVDALSSQRFLDAGSGSGLFSLAARRLGAEVVSFDYDPQSVACTAEIKRRFAPDDQHWHIEQGSVLDHDYLHRLGQFDIVYSWGVLHHTGAMWQALENIDDLVKSDGKLFIAIYNDQGLFSRMWWTIKWLYVQLPGVLKWLVLLPVFVRLWLPATIRDILRGRPSYTWNAYVRNRGMSPWWDVIDWVGGFPYEVATPASIIAFYESRSYRLVSKSIQRGHGCNEFVFEKISP